jgi:hypothetical protein
MLPAIRVFAAALIVTFLPAQIAAATNTATDYPAGPWHYKSIPCVDTTVVTVTPRLVGGNQTTFTKADFESSGVVVTFATNLGLTASFPKERVNVTHYQDTAGNALMASEKRGDRVQVCFLGYPSPEKYCDPDKDDRGRSYWVYDYKRHAAYDGMNSEHDCGGA